MAKIPGRQRMAVFLQRAISVNSGFTNTIIENNPLLENGLASDLHSIGCRVENAVDTSTYIICISWSYPPHE